MKDLLSFQSFLLFSCMLAVTYSTRLIGFFALRNRTLSRRAQTIMEAAPGCCPHFRYCPLFCIRQAARTYCHRINRLGSLPLFYVGYRIDRGRIIRHLGMVDGIIHFKIPIKMPSEINFMTASAKQPYFLRLEKTSQPASADKVSK